MTVLVALEHTRLDDIVTVTPQAAGVGESTVIAPPGRAAHGARPRDRRARAECERRGDGARGSRRPWLGCAVRGDDEREGTLARPQLDALRESTRARPAGPRVERARRDDAAHGGAPQPVHPDVVDEVDGHDRRRSGPDVDRRAARRRCRSSAPRPVTRTPPGGRRSLRSSATACGSRRRCSGHRARAQRNAELASLLSWGLAQYHSPSRSIAARVYGLAETGYGRPPVTLVAREPSFERCGSAGRSSSASW